MIRLIGLVALGALALFRPVSAPATPAAGLTRSVETAAPLSVRDIDGHSWTPLSPATGELNLLLFVSTDCPISSRYAPEIDRIAGAYEARHVHTLLIYTDATIDPAHVRANVAEFHPKMKLPAIIDSGFAVSTAAGATITPEAAIYSAGGRVYRGRIDDLYISIGQSRRAPTTHDVRDALDAVLSGHAVPRSETNAVGCYIERSIK